MLPHFFEAFAQHANEHTLEGQGIQTLSKVLAPAVPKMRYGVVDIVMCIFLSIHAFMCIRTCVCLGMSIGMSIGRKAGRQAGREGGREGGIDECMRVLLYVYMIVCVYACVCMCARVCMCIYVMCVLYALYVLYGM